MRKHRYPKGFFDEDFDGLTLRAFESDSVSGGDGTDWTAQGPSGWAMAGKHFFGKATFTFYAGSDKN